MVILNDLAATETLAARVAGQARTGDLLCLAGPLGAGKTAFARAFLRALHIAEDVPSPTFTLVQTYAAPNGLAIAHFDLYRLESPADVWELGWEDALANALVLVEWPERLGDLALPADRLHITLAPGPVGEESRQVTLTGYGRWAGFGAE